MYIAELGTLHSLSPPRGEEYLTGNALLPRVYTLG